jgi:hypothetical protein
MENGVGCRWVYTNLLVVPSKTIKELEGFVWLSTSPPTIRTLFCKLFAIPLHRLSTSFVKVPAISSGNTIILMSDDIPESMDKSENGLIQSAIRLCAVRVEDVTKEVSRAKIDGSDGGLRNPYRRLKIPESTIAIQK